MQIQYTQQWFTDQQVFHLNQYISDSHQDLYTNWTETTHTDTWYSLIKNKDDGTRGFSKLDQLKGKQLLPMFWPDALVVFRAKVKLGEKYLHLASL